MKISYIRKQKTVHIICPMKVQNLKFVENTTKK